MSGKKIIAGLQDAVKHAKGKASGVVTAVVEKQQTTIDQQSGVVQFGKAGKLKGFGKGLQDYIMRGNQSAQVAVEVNVGEHPSYEGWLVQINLSGFDDKEAADTVADRVAVQIRAMLGLPV